MERSPQLLHIALTGGNFIHPELVVIILTERMHHLQHRLPLPPIVAAVFCISSVSARRRPARQSACRSNRLVITSRYSLAKSSTDISLSAFRSEHSLDAARSDAKASRDSRLHALLVTVWTLTSTDLIILSLKLMSAWSEIMVPTYKLVTTTSDLMITRSRV